jgi:hypothetical protein
MRLLSSILSVLAAVTIAGSGGDDPGTGPVPDPVRNEQALELISACRVSDVMASHSGEVVIALNDEVDEDGWSREVSVAEPDVSALFDAAPEAGGDSLWRRGWQTCARCGLPIAAGAEFDLDHTDDRAGYLGASHQACNRGAPSRDQRRRMSRRW